MGIDVEVIGPGIGAQVTGVDLAQPLDVATRDAILGAWTQYHVIVFPEQRITDAEHVAFSRHFGELEIFPQAADRARDTPEIYRIANADEAGRLLEPEGPEVTYARITESWHTDSSYRPVPSKGAILHGLEIPPEGGDTCWADCMAAYAALPERLKRAIDGRKSRNSFVYMRSTRGLPPMDPAEQATVPDVEHPLVRHHAGGRVSLYISPVYVDAITGLDFEATRGLVEELTEAATRDEFVYRHRWQKDDVVMWDNRCTMHRVQPYAHHRDKRIMHRTTLAGEEPVR